MESPSIYILTNNDHDSFYIGVTCHLSNRLKQLNVLENDSNNKGSLSISEWTKLVYVEQFPTMMAAIKREKEIKKWDSHWQASLIIKANPFWHDLTKKHCELIGSI